MLKDDSTIQRFNDSTTQRLNDSTIQRFNDSTTQRLNKSTNQQLNNSTTQRFNNKQQTTTTKMTSPSKNKENWYVVYTKARWEKKVETDLQKKSIQTYLPLRKTLKQWSDRKKWVEEPLFKSYVFLRISEIQHPEILMINGIVCFVKLAGIPAKVPDQQIEAVKNYLITSLEMVEDNIEYTVGGEVEVKQGLLMGLRGYLLNFKGKHKVQILIEAINKSIIINIPVAHLRKIE